MPLLSVVIPTFNRAETAVAAIEKYFLILQSAVASIDATVEFIIVDDHSEDDSYLALVQRFKSEKNILILRTPQNVGPGLARDFGMKSAKGEWIWFLDDDDEISLDQLKALLDFIKKANLEVDVVAHSLKESYSPLVKKARAAIIKNILGFHEYQEVFRYIFRRKLIQVAEIKFSSGLHEDIRYVFELIFRSSGVAIFKPKVYTKHKSIYAITAKMSIPRIDGYIKAYNEIVCLMQADAREFISYRQSTVNQFLGVLLYLILAETDDADVISCMKHLRLSSGSQDAWSLDVAASPKYNDTATNFKYSGSLWREAHGLESADLLSKLRRVYQTRLSCKDLDASIFLGPDEIRACCKRFFSKGIQKGDVVLLPADESIGLSEIQAAKNALISRINTDRAPECSGCPYIERRDVHDFDINYVSLENFSYCNMKCTYCSPKYYGGTEAKYNAAEIIQELVERPKGLGSNCHVVWGGGEPTLSPRFDSINRALITLPQVAKIRVLSNSLRYSVSLAKNLTDSRFHLVTSIDAGSQDTFRKIRGAGNFDKVLENLELYREQITDPHRLTVKYIICTDNFETHELQSFVERINASNLKHCLFQVSCDFTVDQASDEMICAIYELAIRLKSVGCSTVFFDDLIRDRITITDRLYEIIRKHLGRLGLEESFILTAAIAKRIVLWGDGKQANWLLTSTVAGRTGQIVGVISDATEWFGSDFEKQADTFLYPAGVQSMYEILNNISNSGLSHRIYNGVVV